MSLQEIESRIKSVKNINKITKAMEVVAATRMRRSQEIALASRPYTFAILDLLSALSELEDVTLPTLLSEREIKKTAYVVITSDKGLAGAFNSSILRAFSKYVEQHDIDLKDESNSFIAVGQKAVSFLQKRTHALAHSFVKFGDYTTTEEVEPLSKILIDGYINGDWDEVLIFSTHFKSALSQEVLIDRVLPVDQEHLRTLAKEIVPTTGKFADLAGEYALMQKEHKIGEYIIEPAPEHVLENLARHLVEMQLYHIVLEANASEHAARRAAMKSASDNAHELAEDLTVEYNKSRQAAVTGQIIEIAAGAESLSN